MQITSRSSEFICTDCLLFTWAVSTQYALVIESRVLWHFLLRLRWYQKPQKLLIIVKFVYSYEYKRPGRVS